MLTFFCFNTLFYLKQEAGAVLKTLITKCLLYNNNTIFFDFFCNKIYKNTFPLLYI
jgi:hypothetical protein